MTIRMAEEQARRAGLLKTTTKKKPMARGGARTRCVVCGEEFTGDTAETRHNTEAGHNRFETVLEET